MTEYLSTLGGGKPGQAATLTLALAPVAVVVDCTHTKIDGNFQLAFGKSPATTIERCEFLASAITSAQWPNIKKGLACTLSLYPGGPTYALRLEAGGQVEGGQIFRFMLVDFNYKA